MNATATHDTKRGEGTRARINVLSELGNEWSQKVRQWHTLNKHVLTKNKKGEHIPVKNDEYLLYQTLIGSFPFEPVDINLYRERIEKYMIKAIREGKEHSSWIRPNDAYEKALLRFVQILLSDNPENPFLRDFIPFQRVVAWYGMLNSLSQTALKITTPGIPDFYQGSEFWDFTLVDPDNRSQVTFSDRDRVVNTIIERENDLAFIDELLAHPQDGRVKMFLIRKLLLLRQRLRSVFEHGKYTPLTVKGVHHNSVVAFMRASSEAAVIIAVPRMLTRIIKENQMPLGQAIWEDTALNIPLEYVGTTWNNCLHEGEFVFDQETIALGAITEHFPIAILKFNPIP